MTRNGAMIFGEWTKALACVGGAIAAGYAMFKLATPSLRAAE